MVNCAGWRFGASFLVLSLIVGPAAFAATDNAGQETPSQAVQDLKSYLPPGMQGRRGFAFRRGGWRGGVRRCGRLLAAALALHPGRKVDFMRASTSLGVLAGSFL